MQRLAGTQELGEGITPSDLLVAIAEVGDHRSTAEQYAPAEAEERIGCTKQIQARDR